MHIYFRDLTNAYGEEVMMKKQVCTNTWELCTKVCLREVPCQAQPDDGAAFIIFFGLITASPFPVFETRSVLIG